MSDHSGSSPHCAVSAGHGTTRSNLCVARLLARLSSQIFLVTSALEPLREKARQLTGSTSDITLSPPLATATPAILPSLQATTPATSTESIAAPLTPPSGVDDGGNALEPWMLNLGGPMPLVNPFDQPTSSEWPPSMQVDDANAPAASVWPFDLDSLLDPAASAD